jgi:hypothetical protein
VTLANIPLVMDGPLTGAALFRKGLNASLGSNDGVVGYDDMTVTQNTPAGQSLLVSAGNAAVLNRYQADPDEMYLVSNPTQHLIGSGSMPASAPSLSYYLVCLVVGDPAFDQTGHPYMPSDFDEELVNTFEYNRFVVLPCDAGDTTFADLGVDYPGLALARLAIPASTTTVTNAMITDVREFSGSGRKPSGGLTYASKNYAGTDWQRFDTFATQDGGFPFTDGMASSGGGLIVPTSGLYQVDGWVSFGAGSAGSAARRVVGVSKSNSVAPSVPNYEHEFCGTAGSGLGRFSGQIKMTAGEALYLWYYTDVANHYGASIAGIRATLIR